MLLADTMTYFFLVVGLLFAFPGLWLLCRALWPQMVADSCADLERGLAKPFFIGLPIFIVSVFAFIVLGGSKHGPVGDTSAVLTIALFLFYANVGVAGLVTMLGKRLPSPADDTRPWKRTIRGGIVLELAYLLPLLGWFVVLPVSLIIGAGSVTRRLVNSRKRTKKVSKSNEALNENFVTNDLNAEDAVGTPG